MAGLQKGAQQLGVNLAARQPVHQRRVDDNRQQQGGVPVRRGRGMGDVGVANVNLSKMKNGHISAIRFSTLAAICDVLKCQPGDILEYSPEEKKITKF